MSLKLSLHTTLFDSMATSASSVRLRRESSFKGSAGPKCKCNLESRMKISRSAKNPGRGYYNCPKYPDGDRCGFFAWADELMTEHLADETIGREHQLEAGQILEQMHEMKKELRLMKMGIMLVGMFMLVGIFILVGIFMSLMVKLTM